MHADPNEELKPIRPDATPALLALLDPAGRPRTGGCLIRAVIVICVASMVIALLSRPRKWSEEDNRIECEFRLYTLGESMSRYASANSGRCPPGLDVLIATDGTLRPLD